MQNAGNGSYQALQTAPQSRIDSMHKTQSGRAKGPKNREKFAVFLLEMGHYIAQRSPNEVARLHKAWYIVTCF